jgi:hypothetical protein
MTANEARIHWDREKKRWQIEIHAGAEVIKRPLSQREQQASVDTLQALAVETARDEGYELEASHVTIVH